MNDSILAKLFLPILLATALVGVAACGSGDETPPPMKCTPGASSDCPAGQVCSASGVCEAGGVQGSLAIDAAEARACEVLLESATAKVVDVAFGSSDTGAFRARPPRYAVAVSRTSNTPFDGDSIRVTIDGDTAAVSVKSVACYDASGASISGASASLK